MSKLIKAVFKGKDGSMGYNKNQTYHFMSRVENDWIWIIPVNTWARSCPYSSLEALLKNWKIINERG